MVILLYNNFALGEKMRVNIGVYITRIKQINGRLINKLISDRNIKEFNAEQGRILHVLWEKKEMNNREISKKTGLAMSTLTTMLEKMEEKGLIFRETDSTDTRKIMVRLTEKSEKLEKDYMEISEEMTQFSYDGVHKIDIEEIKIFESILKKVMENVEYAENNICRK